MTKEYYQMGWTLGDYSEDYYFSRSNSNYFIKINTTPLIAALSAEQIVPRLKWTKRLSNGDVVTAQDFENGRNLKTEEMTDNRIPKILHKVHSSKKIKRIMLSQGYKEQTALSSFSNLKGVISKELLENKDIAMAFNYLENNVPEDETFAPCHADLHKNNWLLSNSNKLFLVDWEHAILGDPAIDISFILYKYIPQENWATWLSEYGLDITLSYRLKLKWYIVFQSLIMVIWYYEKRQLSEMNEWLVFINKVFFEYI